MDIVLELQENDGGVLSLDIDPGVSMPGVDSSERGLSADSILGLLKASTMFRDLGRLLSGLSCPCKTSAIFIVS